MRLIIILLFTGLILSCATGKDPFDYSNSFIKLVDNWDDDFEFLGRQIDSMGTQIKDTHRLDSRIFETSVATTVKLSRKFEFLADSLSNADSFNGDNTIKERAINLLQLYTTEIVPVYADFIKDHYDVYGTNDIMRMNASGQDSLNQIIINSQERWLTASEKQTIESQNFENYINDWVERFK